jgi:membrane protein DedA with SNARE-associated domain
VAMACGLLVAGSIHLVKSAAVRPLVTVSTGGAGNVPVSIAEDATATAMSFLSVLVPIAVAVIVAILILLVLWWWARRTSKNADANSIHS